MRMHVLTFKSTQLASISERPIKYADINENHHVLSKAKIFYLIQG